MIQDTIKHQARSLRDLSSDDLLAALGLERRRSAVEVVLPAVSYFAAGALVGAGLSLLFAPKVGKEFRHELGHKARELKDQVVHSAERVADEAQAMLPGHERDRKDNGPVAGASATRSAQTTVQHKAS
jgi:gas vesicle protein